MTNGLSRIASTAEMRSAVLAHLEAGIDSTPALAAKMGLTTAEMSSRLKAMEVAGQVHHTTAKVGGKILATWKIGLAKGDDGKPLSKSGPFLFDAPKISIKQQYPANHFRDPLVAALFGAPKRNAPRCIACGVEQGTGHNRGCIVALVAA